MSTEPVLPGISYAMGRAGWYKNPELPIDLARDKRYGWTDLQGVYHEPDLVNRFKYPGQPPSLSMGFVELIEDCPALCFHAYEPAICHARQL